MDPDSDPDPQHCHSRALFWASRHPLSASAATLQLYFEPVKLLNLAFSTMSSLCLLYAFLKMLTVFDLFYQSRDHAPSLHNSASIFCCRYPYCYGYWKKFADFEKRNGTPERVMEVFNAGTEVGFISFLVLFLTLHFKFFFVVEVLCFSFNSCRSFISVLTPFAAVHNFFRHFFLRYNSLIYLYKSLCVPRQGRI